MDILNKILIVFIVTIAFSDKKRFSAHKRSTTQTPKKPRPKEPSGGPKRPSSTPP